MTLPRTTPFARAASAFWRMGQQETLSYPLALVSRAVNLFALAFLLYFASNLVPSHLLGGAAYAGFALVGLACLQLLGACLSIFPGKLREMQVSGLLEACLMTRTPAWMLLLTMPTFPLGAAALRSILILALAVVLGGSAMNPAGAPVALAALLLGVAAFVSLGLVSAAITLVVKRGDPVAQLVQLASLLLAGPFIPRDTLPTALAHVGAWLPIAPMLDGIRAALLGTPLPADTLHPLLRLAILCAVLLPLAALAVPAAIRRMQRDGSAGQF